MPAPGPDDGLDDRPAVPAEAALPSGGSPGQDRRPRARCAAGRSDAGEVVVELRRVLGQLDDLARRQRRQSAGSLRIPSVDPRRQSDSPFRLLVESTPFPMDWLHRARLEYSPTPREPEVQQSHRPLDDGGSRGVVATSYRRISPFACRVSYTYSRNGSQTPP